MSYSKFVLKAVKKNKGRLPPGSLINLRGDNQHGRLY